MDPRAFGEHFDSADKLFQLVNGTSILVTVCNTLGRGGVIARLLQGPGTAGEIAADCGLPEDRLARMLDYLAAHEIVGRSAEGTYHATDRTQVLHEAGDYFNSTQTGILAGSRLLDSLRDGEKTAFELYYGQPVFAYFGANPDKAATFGAFMGWMTGRFLRFLFAEHRFEPFGTVVDVGGSMGDLLLAILGEYPDARGVLFDLPETVEIAAARVEASPVADRVQLVGGSFFEQVPAGDLYTLKQILHDWNDHECETILRNIRAAINPGGRLAVMDHIVSDPPQPDEAASTDIAMMIWDTGRERRLAEFEALFAASGFRLDRVTRNPAGHSVIEAVPV